MNNMKRKPMFSFNAGKETVAVIQASSKHEARERASLISHLVKIPDGCKVRRFHRRMVCRSPIFFDGHFLAIEEALGEMS